MTPVAHPHGDDHVIVVVDDDEDIRETLRDVLLHHGYRVAVAENGAQALALLDDVAPCLMLTDLTMPVMDGWELVRRLQQRTPLVGFPIVVSTSSPERAPAGFQVIAKPVDLMDVLDVVKRYCAPDAAKPQ